MKHHALLPHSSCCSRTRAIRGVTRKQPFWVVSLLNNWKSNVHEAQWESWKSSPKLSVCSLPLCQWKWKMNCVNGIAHKPPMMEVNPLSYSHWVVNKHKVFPLWEAVARNTLSFLLSLDLSHWGWVLSFVGWVIHKEIIPVVQEHHCQPTSLALSACSPVTIMWS